MNIPSFKVCVSSITYNHANYIDDCMEGFAKQETDFPYICCIVDDASTDGEQNVIKNYLNEHFIVFDEEGSPTSENNDTITLFAQNKKNKNCYFLVYLLKYNHYSIKKPKAQYLDYWKNNAKYIALCEGDDYWTDKDKLQTQVNFLDSNPDYSMCFHKANIVVESGEYSYDDRHVYDSLEEREYFGSELVKKWIIPTASMVYRSNIMPPIDKRFRSGDIKLYLQCSVEGRIYCIGKFMSVYRRTADCATVRNRKGLYKNLVQCTAYIDYFPQYADYYQHVLTKSLGYMVFSRQIFTVLRAMREYPPIFKYLLIGILMRMGLKK